MTLLLLLFLAVLQGLTEFLPVSSSGHLRLLQAAFGVEDPQTLVDVTLHLGTLAAVIAVYWRDLLHIVGSVFRSLRRVVRGRRRDLLRDEPHTRLALLLLLGSVPAAVLGVLLGGVLEANLTSPSFVGLFLLVNGCLLALGGRTRVARGDDRGRPLSQLRATDALVIGCAQAFALLRGISRSGTTISAGLLRGIRRDDAARFSFLLAVPAISGAAVLELRHVGVAGAPPVVSLALAAVAAGFVGWAALRFLLRVVRAGRLDRFAWYCWGLGAVALTAALLGLL